MFTLTKNDTAKDEACSTANEVGHKLREFVDHASHEARDALATTEKQIREHPMKASAIAAGVGFLLGVLLRRR